MTIQNANRSGGIRRILKRDGTVVSYDRDRISTAIFRAMVASDQSDRAVAEQLAEKVESVLVDSYGTDSTPSVEEIQDIVEQTLQREGRRRVAELYMTYRRQRAQARAARAVSFEVTDNIPYKKIYEILVWNVEHGCDSVSGLNDMIRQGRMPWLIDAAERRYQEEIDLCVQQILERKDETRIIIIAGPSSSGKTTTTIRLGERLAAAGINLKAINVDHYFFDRELHPKDRFGDYDYETPQALDLPMIDDHLVRLLNGETIMTPDYDFKTGKRTLDVHEMSLAANEVLLIDSLHGLYGDMTRSIPPGRIFKLYVETLSQLRGVEGVFMRWADIRLMRRMLRDSSHRNSQPMDTLTHWHYVRRSELRHIIPFIGSVDLIINTALAYEVPFLKKRVYEFLPRGVESFRHDAFRQDAYIRAKRLRNFLEPIDDVGDEDAVPENSLLREFIGGSIYKY